VCRPCWNLCRMWVKSCCCWRAEGESGEAVVGEEEGCVVFDAGERWDRRRSWWGLWLGEEVGEERR
jgi:hypothetical protein